MNCLTQSYLFKERLLKCEPIDLGCFVCCGPQGEALFFGQIFGTFFWYASTRAQQQTLRLSSIVRPPYTVVVRPPYTVWQRGPWSHVCRTSFPDACFLIFLAMFFAVWHASDFVPTPYKLKQWPWLTIPPLLVTSAMLMTYKMSSRSFFTAVSHQISAAAWSVLHCVFSRLELVGWVLDSLVTQL